MPFIYTVILWICCAVFTIAPIYHLLRSAGNGDLDMSTAVVIAFILISLGVLTALSGGTPASFGLLLAMLVAGVGAPWAGEWYTRRLHCQLDEDKMEKYRAALTRDPRNSGAHALLAEAYANRRCYAEAVAHYQAALQISPDAETNPHFAKWTRRLKEAQAEKAQKEAKKGRKVGT